MLRIIVVRYVPQARPAPAHGKDYLQLLFVGRANRPHVQLNARPHVQMLANLHAHRSQLRFGLAFVNKLVHHQSPDKSFSGIRL
jgi:hypothetical protein